MYRTPKLGLLWALCILLAACASSAPAPDAALPDWWTNPPQDDDQFLYGTGEGYNQSAATQQALASIAGKLRTSISANFHRLTTESNVAASNYEDRTIQSSVGEVNFSSYAVKQVQTVPMHTRVLVQLDAKQNAIIWQKELDDATTAVQAYLAKDAKGSRFLTWYQHKPVLAQAQKADMDVIRLMAIQHSSTHPPLLAPQVQARADALADGIRIKLQSNMPGLVARMANQLSKQIKYTSCSSGCDLAISANVVPEYSRIFGQDVATYHITGAISSANAEIAQSTWTVSGSAISGADTARQAAEESFADGLADKGIWASFGLD